MFRYWVARDQDGSLFLFEGKNPPKRDTSLDSGGVWLGENDAIPVPDGANGEGRCCIEWEDEPAMVDKWVLRFIVKEKEQCLEPCS